MAESIFEKIKDSLSMKEVVDYYGYSITKGKCICPFHDDNHPSMVIKSKKYHCYACGEYGDMFDFVSKLHNISNVEAANRLIEDFHLPYSFSSLKQKENMVKESCPFTKAELSFIGIQSVPIRVVTEWTDKKDEKMSTIVEKGEKHYVKKKTVVFNPLDELFQEDKKMFHKIFMEHWMEKYEKLLSFMEELNADIPTNMIEKLKYQTHKDILQLRKMFCKEVEYNPKAFS